MEKINFQNGASGSTPLNATNLNQMQSNMEESAVIVSATEPTTSEKVWIQKGNNLFNEQFRQGGWNNTTAATRIYSSQNKIIEAGQYTFSTDIDTSIYKLSINVSTNTFPNTSGSFYDSGWITTNEKTFTTSKRGYLGIGISRVDGGELTPDDIKDFYFQVNTGSEVKPYEAYISTKMWVKNDNGVFEEFYKEKKEVVLYSNSNGTQDAITLNASYTNYSKIRVLFGISWLKKYVELDVLTGSNIPLELSYGLSNGTQFQTNISMLKLEDNTANFLTDRTYTCVFSASSNSLNTTNSLYIYEIVGIE